MVEFKRFLTPLFVLSISYLIFYTIINMKKKSISNFVAFNKYSIPESKSSSEKVFKHSREQFGRLIQLVNDTNHQMSYDMENILDSFEKILNNQNVGKFNILSIGDTKPFALYDVIIQNVENLSTIKLNRVDFMTDSLNPFLIKNVMIQEDKKFSPSQYVLPRQELQNDLQFRIKNPLNLFSPYDTSFNENVINQDDLELLKNVIKEKEIVLKTL
jgi:hypothetical protein